MSYKVPYITVKMRERSGSVVDWRPMGPRVRQPHQRHCIVVLEQDTFILA